MTSLQHIASKLFSTKIMKAISSYHAIFIIWTLGVSNNRGTMTLVTCEQTVKLFWATDFASTTFFTFSLEVTCQ